MRCIVTNNCWGSGYYQENNIPYNTPFVGLFFRADHYLRLLSKFRENIAQDLYFPEDLNSGQKPYPIGRLTDSIDIQFLHYKTREEAAEKWSRRVSRLPKYDEDIIFKICDRDGFEERHIPWFDSLNFHNKIMFLKAGRFANIPPYACEVNVEDGDTCPDGVTLWRLHRGSMKYNINAWMLKN